MDEVPDNQEISGETHTDNHFELVVRPFTERGGYIPVPLFQSDVGEVAEVVGGGGELIRYDVFGEEGTGQGYLEVASLGYGDGVFEGPGQLREKSGHLFLTLQVELISGELHAV